MAESFGAYLRKERELRFVELEEIAKATMISLRFLEYIENDEFENLPHSTFVKGFIRAYSKYIGLDQDEVITNYEHFIQSDTEDEVPEQLSVSTQPIDYNKIGIWGGVLAALLVVVIIIYATFSGDEQTPATSVTPAPEVVSTVTSVPEEVDKVESPAAITKEPEPVADKTSVQSESKAETKPPSSTPVEIPVSSDTALVEVGDEQGVRLQIKAREESYILYQLDDEEAKEIMLKKDKTKTLTAKEKIVLTVGNAAGVEVWLNGEALPPLGKEGQVVRDLVFEARHGRD